MLYGALENIQLVEVCFVKPNPFSQICLRCFMYSDFYTVPQVLGHIVLRYVCASQTYLDLTETQSCKQEADKQAALSQAENQGPCL